MENEPIQNALKKLLDFEDIKVPHIEETEDQDNFDMVSCFLVFTEKGYLN